MMTRMKDFITPLCQKSKILIRPQYLEDTIADLGFTNNIPISEYQILLKYLKISIYSKNFSSSSGFERVENESIIEERFQASIQQNALFGGGQVSVVLGGFSSIGLLCIFELFITLYLFRQVGWFSKPHLRVSITTSATELQMALQ